jgi:hypothetical protein
MKKSSIYFEITDAADLVRVEIVGITDGPSIDHQDKQWLDTTVTVKGSVFSGQYSAEFMPVDFYRFRQQLVSLIYNLEETATFEGTEGYLKILFNVEPDGYTQINVTACDVPGIGGKLSFGMGIEQSDVERLIKQLDAIVELYPFN